jgi:hypothetical protein
MTGLDVIDVSDTGKPVLIGSCFLDGYARDAAIAGSVAYAVDNPSGFYVLDVSNVKPAEVLEPSTTSQEAIAPQRIELSDGAGVAFAVLVGGEPYDPNRSFRVLAGARPRAGTLQIWDRSNATAPKLAALFRTPGSPREVALKGALAYVADSEEGLQVVDLSTLSNPTIVASYKTAAPAWDVAVADSVVLVVVGNAVRGSASQTSGEVVLLRHHLD